MHQYFHNLKDKIDIWKHTHINIFLKIRDFISNLLGEL